MRPLSAPGRSISARNEGVNITPDALRRQSKNRLVYLKDLKEIGLVTNSPVPSEARMGEVCNNDHDVTKDEASLVRES